jgi:hypothetical protein
MSDPTFVVINGFRMITQCSLTVEVETMDVTPMTETKPDYRWTLTDARGHFHAFSTDTENPLPTLERKTRERAIFDDDLEEPDIWEESYYECRLCAQEIEPKWITNPVTWERRVPVRKLWKLEVVSRGELGSRHLTKWRNSLVSLVIETPNRSYFGIGYLEITSIESSGTTHALLTGHGALGTRDA